MPYRDHTKKSDSVKHWTGLFFDIESFFRCGGLLGGDCLAAIVERGGLLAGAAHPRRQKHREMPPPGAPAPAFAATVEPRSAQIRCDVPPTYLRHASRATHLMNAC